MISLNKIYGVDVQQFHKINFDHTGFYLSCALFHVPAMSICGHPMDSAAPAPHSTTKVDPTSSLAAAGGDRRRRDMRAPPATAPNTDATLGTAGNSNSAQQNCIRSGLQTGCVYVQLYESMKRYRTFRRMTTEYIQYNVRNIIILYQTF